MSAGTRQMYDYVITASGGLTGSRMLEIGFGRGKHIGDIFNKTGLETMAGIDISGSMVRTASRINRFFIVNKKLVLLQGSSSDIPFASSEFDSVLSLNTMYFWASPLTDLKQILRVLKPGGRFILAINSKELMLKNAYRDKYFNFYSKHEVENLLSKSGFINTTYSYQKLNIEDCQLFISQKEISI
jgi:ubiquinone/menaquinone biosynthesis C-methylase UbiE